MWMRYKLNNFLVVSILSFYSATVFADLPLTIEDLLTAENRYRLQLGLAFANSDRQQVASRFQVIETSSGQFIQVPVAIGETRANADILLPTVGFRYGFSKEVELYTQLTGVLETTRFEDTGGTGNISNQRLSDLTFGINKRFSEDNKTAALLGFAELGVVENIASDGNDYVYGKNLQLGLTTYRTIDPLVLSLTTGYRYSAERKINTKKVKPGDFFYVNPSVGFAVNSSVTLTTGMQLSWRAGDEFDGVNKGIDSTKTKLQFGLGYAWNKKLTISVESRADISGNSGSEVSLTASYKFWNPKNAMEKIEEKLKKRQEDKKSQRKKPRMNRISGGGGNHLQKGRLITEAFC